MTSLPFSARQGPGFIIHYRGGRAKQAFPDGLRTTTGAQRLDRPASGDARSACDRHPHLSTSAATICC
jgi:hypothetical protein